MLICEDFVFIGWCDMVEGECLNLYFYDCFEFWFMGKCLRGVKCKFRYMFCVEKGRVVKIEIIKEEEKKSKKMEVLLGSFEE